MPCEVQHSPKAHGRTLLNARTLQNSPTAHIHSRMSAVIGYLVQQLATKRSICCWVQIVVLRAAVPVKILLRSDRDTCQHYSSTYNPSVIKPSLSLAGTRFRPRSSGLCVHVGTSERSSRIRELGRHSKFCVTCVSSMRVHIASSRNWSAVRVVGVYASVVATW